jgi:hypothetical protein
LLGDVVSVDKVVIAIGVEMMVKDEGSVHEGTGVHKTASLLDNHALKVKDENSIENLECEGTLPSKNHDLFVSYLIGITHVGRDPVSLIAILLFNELPSVALDIVDLNDINNALLIDSPTE